MKTSSKRRKSKYSIEFKRDAVALTEERPVSVVAKELGISCSLLSRWRQKHQAAEQPNEESLSHKDLLIAYKKLQEDNAQHQKTNKELSEKYKEIEKDNRTIKAINSVLKKTTAIFSQDQLKRDIS